MEPAAPSGTRGVRRRRAAVGAETGPISFLATPWAGRPVEQYRIAGVLLAIGVVLWGVTVLVNKRTGAATPRFDPAHLTGQGPTGPHY